MTPEERIEEYDPRQRYRLYRAVNNDGDLEHVGHAGSPEPGGIGQMLVQFTEDGEISSSDFLGVLDTDAWQKGEPGLWLLNPFAGRFVYGGPTWALGETRPRSTQ